MLPPRGDTVSAMKRVVYVDMDGTLVDFLSARPRVPDDVWVRYLGHEDDIPGIFALMDPMTPSTASRTSGSS